MSDPQTPVIGHNKAPIVLPKEDEMLAELQRKHPDIDIKLSEFETAFKEYPEVLSLDEPDVAEAYQDLIGQVSTQQKIWGKVSKPAEKGPLDKLVKVVTNFFTKADEKADVLVGKYKPRYDDYLMRKGDAEKARQEAEAAAQREKERLAREQAEKAQEEQRQREAAAAESRRKEEEARAAAEKAEREKRESEARAAAAQAEERRLADEKKARDRAEKERNETSLREIKSSMKSADRVHLMAEAGEASDQEIDYLDSLIKHGGTIGHLAGPVSVSTLLDDDQKAVVADIKAKLEVYRTAHNARLNKRERDKREKAAREAAAREAVLAETARKNREEEDRKLAAARAEREREEAETQRLRDEAAARKAEAKDAGAEAKASEQDAKQSARDVRTHSGEADRSANRADRVENRLNKSTEADLSRTRGDLGTVGRLQRRWTYTIKDEAKLMGEVTKQCKDPAIALLLGQLESGQLDGAVFRFMRLHQEGWKMTERERVDDALPGVVFAYELEAVVGT